jgi:hypothetical protein
LRIIFPDDYPNSPPNVLFPFQALPSFVHPNLYSFGICLDILQSYIGDRIDRAGWSRAYTVQTILLQLQSFLFEFDAAPQDHGGTYCCHYTAGRIARVRAEAAAMTCACGHCGASPRPALLPLRASRGSTQSDPRPGLGEHLSQVRRDIAVAEARIAEARHLPMSGPLNRHTAYLSASDEPKVFKAHVSEFQLRVVRVHGDSGSAFARTGFLANPEEGWIRMLMKSTHPTELGSAEMRRFRNTETAMCKPDSACAVLLLRNVQVCVETEGCRFSEGSRVPDASQAQLHRQTRERAARSAQLLPELREREQELLRQKEKAAQLQQQRDTLRLQAEEKDLVKHLHDGVVRSTWAMLAPGLLLQAFMHLDVAETVSLQRACKVWRRLSLRCSLAERIQLRCFYTKQTAREDILGFGISVDYHDDGNIKEVGTELDVVSAEAFYDHRLRHGAWGGDFTHFLPIVLEADHTRRAMPALKRALASIAQRQPAAAFEPWMALAVVPQVMNSFVVSLMREEDGLTTDAVPRHASEKALLGYCSFHHMLLALRLRHPEIGDVATDRLRRFIGGQRSKAHAPDLGQLLVYMSLTEEVRWEDLAAAVLAESHVRCVRWTLRDRPMLERAVALEDRLQWTFESRLTSLRLLMFQAFFLRSIARPEGESLAAGLARYDRQFGQPTGPQKERLVCVCREILCVSGWPSVYEALGLAMPAAESLGNELCGAIHKSRQLGYHGGPTLLQDGRRGAQQDRVGIRKCIKQAFQEVELQKVRERQGSQSTQRMRKGPKQIQSRVCRNGFAALLEDSDEEVLSE